MNKHLLDPATPEGKLVTKIGTLKEGIPLKEYTKEQVAEHAEQTDCWLIINKEVFDFTAFFKDMDFYWPTFKKVAGTDASEMFDDDNPMNKHLLDPATPEGKAVTKIGTLKEGTSDDDMKE